jgi:chemotaxis response regulator CheB
MKLLISPLGVAIHEIHYISVLTVLVVDNVNSWRQFVSSTLHAEPSFEVICEVSDGLKAVKMAKRLQPSVILLDIGL